MLDDARRRGWGVLVFCPGQGTHRATPLPVSQDPYGARLQAAIWEDVFAAFPQADGGIMDGWTESPCELDFHHGHVAFRELRDNELEAAEVRGWDTARLDAGREHLRRRFHSFTSKMVGYYGADSFLQGINLFDLNEDALYWLRWRRDDGLAVARAFRSELDQLSRKLLLGNGLRSAVFSGVTAIDFSAWDEILDILLVKHYFWHRGYDGLYGTVARWGAADRRVESGSVGVGLLHRGPRLARRAPPRSGIARRHGTRFSPGLLRRCREGRDSARPCCRERSGKDLALG